MRPIVPDDAYGPFTFIARKSIFLEDSFTERVKTFIGAHGYRTSDKIKFVFF